MTKAEKYWLSLKANEMGVSQNPVGLCSLLMPDFIEVLNGARGRTEPPTRGFAVCVPLGL
jgi:hypothetical protein